MSDPSTNPPGEKQPSTSRKTTKPVTGQRKHSEPHKEDLINDATAFVDRCEWTIPNLGAVFAGMKRDGSLSIYFEEEPVYQFDASLRLRRAHVGGFIYRTQGEFLARLHRQRYSNVTTLERHDLRDEMLTEFLASACQQISRFIEALADGSAQLRRSVLAERSVDTIIDCISDVIPIRLAPEIRTKRK